MNVETHGLNTKIFKNSVAHFPENSKEQKIGRTVINTLENWGFSKSVAQLDYIQKSGILF